GGGWFSIYVHVGIIVDACDRSRSRSVSSNTRLWLQSMAEEHSPTGVAAEKTERPRLRHRLELKLMAFVSHSFTQSSVISSSEASSSFSKSSSFCLRYLLCFSNSQTARANTIAHTTRMTTATTLAPRPNSRPIMLTAMTKGSP